MRRGVGIGAIQKKKAAQVKQNLFSHFVFDSKNKSEPMWRF